MPAPARQKPAKPYPGFPLFAHATGRWAKKIRGKFHYFGPWSDPDAALNKYLAERDDLHAGRTPRPPAGGVTVADLCNHFLAAKQHRVESGELSVRTFGTYYATCRRMAEFFGRDRAADDVRPDDLEGLRAFLACGRGPVALANEVRHVRMVFKFADDAELTARPARLKSFRAPARHVLRKARQTRQKTDGLRMFEAAEVRSILAASPPGLRAMVLLGINRGYGQADCAGLHRSSLDLAGGWIDYPRPKTGVPRRSPLWPETVAAIRQALPLRPAPLDPRHADLVFLTRQGKPWVRAKLTSGGGMVSMSDAVGQSLTKLLNALSLKRPGLSFYALRHGFQTIASETRDQPAIDLLMGRLDDSMASRYRERIGDDRLRAVTDHVRTWLFPPAG